MNRVRGIALGLGLLASAGGWYLSARDAGGAEVQAEGRYRDGRGRMGREGPRRGGPSCTSVTGTAQNDALWSQALDNAVWTTLTNVVAPTVTANVAVAAPACADTFNIAGCGQTGVVDRVDFPATALTKFSAIRQVFATPIDQANDTYVYCKAVGADCDIEIGSNNATHYYVTKWTCTSTWARISDLNSAIKATPQTIYIGNMGAATRPSATLGDETRGACSVYLFQADAHAAGTNSRPVKTTTAAASQGPGCY